MSKVPFVSVLVLAFTCALSASPARAAGPGVFFISANGSDRNGCTASAPCLTVDHVLTLSPPAGSEIDCIIPGEISEGLTLTQSITINCPGGVVFGSIMVTTSGAVTLRGIHLQGFGVGGMGFSGGGTLTLDNVLVDGCGSGLVVSSGGNVSVTNSKFTNCSAGIFVNPQNSSDVALVSLSHVTVEKNTNGILVQGTGKSEVNLVDSVVTSNAGNGVSVIGVKNTAQLQFMTIQRSSLVMNGTGLLANSGFAFVLVGESSIAWNATDGIFTENGAFVFSYANNQINGNGMNDLSGTVSTAGLQ